MPFLFCSKRGDSNLKSNPAHAAAVLKDMIAFVVYCPDTVGMDDYLVEFPLLVPRTEGHDPGSFARGHDGPRAILKLECTICTCKSEFFAKIGALELKACDLG